MWVPRASLERGAVGVDAQKEGGVGAVRDPRAGDVPHALAGRPRPRHHDAYPCPAEQLAEAERDRQREVGLANPGDDAVGAASVEDLARRRARPDRLGAEVREPVVPGVDHDDRRRRVGCPGADRRDAECRDQRRGQRKLQSATCEEGAWEAHCGGMRCRIQT